MDIEQLRRSFDQVTSEIASGPFMPEVTAAEIRDHLQERYDFGCAMPLHAVAADVESMLRAWQVQVTHPRYLGLFNPSVSFASVAAEALVATYNPQLANWRTAPAPNEMERHVLGWLAAKFGLPSDTIATFTSGGMEANLSAVIVALTRAFPSYATDGLGALEKRPAIYLSEGSHHGFHKIAHVSGLGRAALRLVATDKDLKMPAAALERRIAEDREAGWRPFLVVANAGTTGAGVIDPLAEIAELCRRQELWFHVDAAWGGAAILSPGLKPHLAGIERADSVTCDAHKWFSVAMGAGMFFCRHRASVAEAFRAEVSYMPGTSAAQAPGSEPKAQQETHDADIFNPFTHSLQWSRRFTGLKLFMSLAELGEAGYAAQIDHQAQLGELLRTLLQASGWRLVNATPLPLVCFTREGLVPARLLQELRQRQIAWMSETEVRGEPVMRACITSFRTTASEIEWIVEQMNALVAIGTSHRESYESKLAGSIAEATDALRAEGAVLR